uniref:NADH dehydrogenase subunit 6 n=1 Tax=Mooreana trichoneura TaxID=2866486 RepID=UPI001EE0FF0A|nr:NADH dehydrogenase subunit 6 [Mooreana trichoneura]UJV31552.1 NADH dehydrogenase subunit 6 [Mooreana trichoneura]
MFKMFLFMIIIFISIFMFFLKHPLSMGLAILIQTLLICLISGLFLTTYWFSYILFLTFLGGLLILFIYVSSIASNEMFHFNWKNKLLTINMMMMMIIMFLMIYLFYNYLFLIYNSFEFNKFFNYFFFINNNNNINLTKLYNEQTYLLMIMMIIYLFITLVAVVKITNIFYGPLRSN